MKTGPRRAVLSLAVLVLLALPAAAGTAKQGMDLFTTPGGGGTTVDLTLFPLESVFGQGATAQPSLVSLAGKPIAGLGTTDTVVQRFDDVLLSGAGDSGRTDIQLLGLRLVSEKAVAITASGTTRHWNLEVGLSNRVGSTGTMVIRQNNADGGTFDTRFTVLPRLVFRRTGEADVVIDCGEVLCDPMTLSSSNSYWVTSDGSFSPASAGVPVIADGTRFDGDGDGTSDDTFAGGSNFYPGFAPSPGYPPVQLSHDHPPVGEHLQVPNTECKTVAAEETDPTVTTGSATAATGDAAIAGPQPAQTLCPAVATPTDA